MHDDAASLRDFYHRPLGQVVRRLIAARIRARWRKPGASTLIGLGFATPYLGSFRGEVACIGALMPAAQGALVWPDQPPHLSVLVDDHQLPVPDSSVDRLLAIHCLEASESARPLLREMWRVLAPEGRLLLVVPNRRSMWARLDRTPFGHGRPYSRGQLERLLGEALLTPLDWSFALHLPPIERRVVLRSALAIERLGARVSPALGGVIIVEAKKELLLPVGGQKLARRIGSLVTVRP
jgi:SAM-dependent methyltransferase